MPLGRPRWIQVLLSSIWCLAVCWFATNPTIYKQDLSSTYFGAALFTSVIIYLRLRPSWRDAVVILIVAAALAAFDFLFMHFDFVWIAMLSLVGCAGFIIFGVRCITETGAQRKLLLPGLLAGALFSASDFVAPFFLDMTAKVHPKTLDLFLLSFDGSLGFQPSFVIGELFQRAHWLESLSMFVYITLPFSMAVAYSNQLLRNRSFGYPMMLAFVITGPIGVLFYNMFPATGPIHLFLAQFPNHAPVAQDLAQVLLAPVAVDAPRNAIPSLHMAWVILAWWWSRGLSWLPKTFVLLYVVFTFLATLGSGEHYLIDLVVAVPFAVMLQGLVTVRGRNGFLGKLWPPALGLLGVLLWFAILRFAPQLAWSSPAVPWLLMALTLVVYLIVERRYCRLSEDDAEQKSKDAAALSATAD